MRIIFGRFKLSLKTTNLDVQPFNSVSSSKYWFTKLIPIYISFVVSLDLWIWNIFFVTYLTTQRGTRLYFDHSCTEPVNGKRLKKQENDLSEARCFQGPRASTLQSKMTTYSFERAFSLEEKRKRQQKKLVIIDSLNTYCFTMLLRNL